MKNSLPYLAILYGLLVCAGIVHAESGMETKEADKQPAEQTKPAQKSAPDKKPLKEFTPSEEISIDKPVAFPVDI